MSSMALHIATDAEILAAHKRGEREQALHAFVRKHHRFVYSVALRHLRHTEDAQDATQDVFLRAGQNLGSFAGDASLQTWLYRITVNVCVSMRRKQRFLRFFAPGEAEGELDVASTALSPHAEAEQRDFYQTMQTILDSLPAKQRETFCLRFYDELSYEEISAITGTSVGALKSNYHWAVKKIAEALRQTEHYENWRQQ